MRGVAIDDVLPHVDSAVIALVVEKLRGRDEVRRRRRGDAMALAVRSPRKFTDALDRLRVRMADSADESSEKRGSPFADLMDGELTLLECALTRYEAVGRFECRNGVVKEEEQYLRVLRANYVAGREVVDGNTFRAAAVPLLRHCLTEAVAFATPHQRMERMSASLPPRVVVVLPWRAALLAGEAAQQLGIAHFWHLGCARNEETLAPTMYYERRADANTRKFLHIIVEPMLATGGTLGCVIEQLRTCGVPTEKIVVTSVVAAPEGVDRLLHCYPQLRIVTAALDLQLDSRGYIAGPGLGDFGDLAMAGVNEVYAKRHWVDSGLITAEEAMRVFQRTQSIAAAHQSHPPA